MLRLTRMGPSRLARLSGGCVSSLVPIIAGGKPGPPHRPRPALGARLWHAVSPGETSTCEAGGAVLDNGVPPRRMRADARRNRERLLTAARDALVDQGVDAPLEEIARRAGVGVGTLYRRFPDRQALLRDVALQVLSQVTDEARAALAEEPDAYRALARYLHRALDLRIAAVMPVLTEAGPIGRDEEFQRARDDLGRLFESMVTTAQREGLLRPDVGVGEAGRDRGVGEPEHRGQFLGRYRAGEVEALPVLAAGRAQLRELCSGLNAFGHGGQPQRLSQLDDRAGQGARVGGVPGTGHERLVDLDDVDRELAQVGQ